MAKATSLSDFIKKVLAAVAPRVSQIQEQAAERFFSQLKKEVIDAVIADPISQELINHTTPSAILGTPGSLYGFLGIEKGVEPVAEIIKVIEQKMKYMVSKRLIRRSLKMTVTLPTSEDFRTPELVLKFEGGYSVLDAIEKGISGLGNFVRSSSTSSRSGEGVQVKHAVRSTEFRKKNWLTKIFQGVADSAKNFR